MPRLLAQLRAIGVNISKRQLVRLLIGGQDAFLAEARDLLRSGLETANWINGIRLSTNRDRENLRPEAVPGSVRAPRSR